MTVRAPGLATLGILRAIANGRLYGADIIESTALGGGTVYKILRRVEDRGWIVGSWEDPDLAEAEKRPRRRFYALTDEGEEAIAEAMERAVRLAGPLDTARGRA